MEKYNFIITVSRAMKITPKYISKTIRVYNGKKFNELVVTETMIGFKAGYFVPTRSNYNYKKK
jgi:ribosomal protein S19